MISEPKIIIRGDIHRVFISYDYGDFTVTIHPKFDRQVPIEVAVRHPEYDTHGMYKILTVERRYYK